MNKEFGMNLINLDFCILSNPLNENKSPIIFVTRMGENHLDASIIDEDDYEKAIYAIQRIGYIESDILTFEFSQDPDYPVMNQEKIVEILENQGMKYSKNLENNLKTEFDELRVKNNKDFLINERKQEKGSGFDIERFFRKNQTIFKVPEVGEKISLYFYLFLECKFKENNCFLNFNGDFFSNLETNTRNFIQNIKCDFIRINNPYNPNKIILKSCPNNKEILKKVSMFKNGSFTRDDGISGKIFVYHLMEVKNNIPDTGRVTIEIDNLENFDNMVLVSKKIKKEYELERQKLIEKKEIVEVISECKDVLQQKMLKHADEDEFEKASVIKRDIEYIDLKLSQLEKEEDKISIETVAKKYHIN